MIDCTNLEKIKGKLLSSLEGRRIYYEIQYLCEVANSSDKQFNSLLENAMNVLAKNECSISLVEKIEKSLLPIKKEDCLKEAIYVAHAHLDMNWQWGWDETVAITLSTFRTTLDLMKQYDFSFGQSQASCYKIVEEYDPDMLEEIRQRIKEGRWEVTASSWVETDRNMPLPETHIRQNSITRKYLSKLLNLDVNKFNLSFEPDTFGHNALMPEIFNKCGVKWLYHGRGHCGDYIYRWRSKSDAEVLTYCEPMWYITEALDADLRNAIRYAPTFAKKYGLEKTLHVVGIGDHGGGITRKSLDLIEEMKRYPLFPKIRFGSYKEFFEYLETKKDNFKVVYGEQNTIFDGCYTSQSKIKKAYKNMENNLIISDSCNAMGLFNKYTDQGEKMNEAWQKLSFNTFHDILPGSCVAESRDYSLGLMQEASAIAESVRALSVRSISEKIDYSIWNDELLPRESGQKTAIGAGVGYKNNLHLSYDVSRSDGKGRVFVLFNSLPFERETVVELPIYDWDVDFNNLEALNSKNEPCRLQLLWGTKSEWLHQYITVGVWVKVPSFGYETILIRQNKNIYTKYPSNDGFRVQEPKNFDLENEYLKVKYNSEKLTAYSILDKENNKELPIKDFGQFHFGLEDCSMGMSSWTVGRIFKKEEIIPQVSYPKFSGSVINGFDYEVDFSNSKLRVSPRIEGRGLIYKLKYDWLEVRKEGTVVPQLSVSLKLDDGVRVYKDFCEALKPIEDREMDFASARCVYCVDKEKNAFVLVSKDKYGFRYNKGVLSITLIRSSFDPDKYPEFGSYESEFSLISVCNKHLNEIDAIVRNYTTPIVFASITGRGEKILPMSNSFISFNSKSSVISEVHSDGNNSLYVTIRNYGDLKDNFEIKTQNIIKSVCACDNNGNGVSNLKFADNKISGEISSNKIISLLFVF